jgi:hypothetical protein
MSKDLDRGDLNRRPVLKAVGIALAVASLLPKSWTKPVVQSVVVPAHAAASPCKV